jgi:hypothetical protein
MPSALDRLKKAANMTATKKMVVLSNGDEFEFWSKPLVMAERDRARKETKSADPQDWLLPLLILKCLDENGQPMFKFAQADEIKNEVRDTDIQKIVLAIIGEDAKLLEAGN